MSKIHFSLLAIFVLIISCTTTKTTSKVREDEKGPHIVMDTMTIMPDTDISIEEYGLEYQAAEERKWDLQHTMLDLSFDWNQSAVIGKATLTLSPLFYNQNTLELDAVGFKINSLMVNGKPSTDFKYDDNVLSINFPQAVTRRDKVTLIIDYVAKPRASTDHAGVAITGDNGLYFIDPLDTIPGLPRQIWTQGETSSNRKWFPTIDQPNERGTQEIFLTVADSFMTLSNGSLISSTKLNNGMRRDHWKLDIPHAPYLAMVAVGKWDKVSDTWRGRPVDYYVDPGYGKDAREIFANTPEMIEFFSEKLGLDFVWPKYAQIIVKDFVSGAMENSTAVVFGDFIQFHTEDMLETGANDYIVSHELFHHWFGNLVTTESWANLTLNEGFANYAEYLWTEHKHGRERANVQRISELSGYYDQAAYDVHPLIHYHYADENDMFDAHSYNKGGLVLHMLRDLVGDEAFFASLRLYLQRHAYTAVEVDDLRQAFEETTGTDLNWFFNQWYFGKGHPILEVSHSYDEAQKSISIYVAQTQSEQNYLRKFRLPLEIGTYHADGSHVIHKIWLEEDRQSFTFPVKDRPSAVVVDPRDIMLMVVNQEIPPTEYETRLTKVPAITHRISAFRVMESISDAVVEQMLADSSTTIRGLAIQYLADQGNVDRLFALANTETNLDLRFFIFQSMVELDPEKAKTLAVRFLETTDKNPIIYDALVAVANVDLDEASRLAARFENNQSHAVYVARAAIFAKKGESSSYEFFTNQKASSIPVDYLEEFISSFALYLSKQNAVTQQKGLDLIQSDFFLRGPNQQYRRFYIITGLVSHYASEFNMTYKEKVRQVIKAVYAREEDSYLKEVLKEGFGEILD